MKFRQQTNQPTNPPNQYNQQLNRYKVLLRPGGVGNREALKAPRSKLGNPPKEPRPPPPEPADSAMLAPLAACVVTPRGRVDGFVVFFFWGGGVEVELKTKSVLGFFG